MTHWTLCSTQILHSYVWFDLFHPVGVYLCALDNPHPVNRASFSQVHQNRAREWKNLLVGWMCLLQLPRFAANRLHSLRLCLLSFLSLWRVLVTKDELNCNVGCFFQKLFVEILKNAFDYTAYCRRSMYFLFLVHWRGSHRFSKCSWFHKLDIPVFNYV